MSRYGLIAMCVSAVVPGALAQVTTAPAEQAEPLTATVIQLEGRAFHAPSTAKALDAEAWQPVKVGDEFPAGTQLRTPLRSKVLLQFGDDTLVLIHPMTNASIDEFYKRADTKKTRLSLGYGKLRAGVAEGALRSDLTIDSPVATLSKRGTWDFGMEVRRGGYTQMFLHGRGLVDAVFQLTGQRRLRPGQYVNIRTIARLWVMQLATDRAVSMYDFKSLTGAEVDFAVLKGSGLGTIDPAGGVQTASLAGRGAGALAGAPAAVEEGLGTRFFDAGALLNRPEGNFGFGGAGALGDLLKRAMRSRVALRDRSRTSMPHHDAR